MSSQDQEIILIGIPGDIVLRIEHSNGESATYYRVSSDVLSSKSSYFHNLLDPDKFNEGRSVHAKLRSLRELNVDFSRLVSSDLPVVTVSDLGYRSRKQSRPTLTESFLRVLHDLPPGPQLLSVGDIAHVAIMADRVSAAYAIRASLLRHGSIGVQPPFIRTKRTGTLSVMQEEAIRQKILTGVMLDLPHWIVEYSQQLVIAGSSRWNAENEHNEEENTAPWWQLPRGIEEELMHRRERILVTIGSLQSHFLSQYNSKQRQCRLGYDSSPQCDLFQLGQMIRFLTLKGTITLQSTIEGSDYIQPYEGSIWDLMKTLRECPSYQIDQNHTHCGLRGKLMPNLDLILIALAPVCADMGSWNDRMHRSSWLETPVGGDHVIGPAILSDALNKGSHSGSMQKVAKELFTAEHRVWMPNS